MWDYHAAAFYKMLEMIITSTAVVCTVYLFPWLVALLFRLNFRVFLCCFTVIVQHLGPVFILLSKKGDDEVAPMSDRLKLHSPDASHQNDGGWKQHRSEVQ